MTGNTLWMAHALVQHRFVNVAYYASVIGSYVAGLVLYRKISTPSNEQVSDSEFGRPPIRSSSKYPLYALIVTSLFLLSDLLYAQTKSTWIPTSLLAAAFGLVNSVATQATGGTLTFVVTGAMTKLTNQLTDMLSSPNKQRFLLVDLEPNERTQLNQNAMVLLGFFGGAAWATVFQSAASVSSLLSTYQLSVIGALFGSMFVRMYLKETSKFAPLANDHRLISWLRRRRYVASTA